MSVLSELFERMTSDQSPGYDWLEDVKTKFPLIKDAVSEAMALDVYRGSSENPSDKEAIASHNETSSEWLSYLRGQERALECALPDGSEITIDKKEYVAGRIDECDRTIKKLLEIAKSVAIAEGRSKPEPL